MKKIFKIIIMLLIVSIANNKNTYKLSACELDIYEQNTISQLYYDTMDEINQLSDNYVQSGGLWVTNNGDYIDKWENYNCYAYAINRTEQPNFYELQGNQYMPGDFSLASEYNDVESYEELLNLIKSDLEAIGYSNVNFHTSIPNTLGSNTELFCVRTILDNAFNDCHFMRYDKETQAWYHKPSNSAVLKYKYTPSNSLYWVNEISYRGTEYRTNLQYSSIIYYITYENNIINLSSNNYISLASKNIFAGKDTIYKINIQSNLNYEFKLTANHALEINLYDNEMDLLTINKLYYNNGKTIGFKKLLNVGVYYLRINYQNKYQYGDVNIGLGHIHSKLFASYKDQISHEITCLCREKYSERHYVDYADANDGDNKALCLGCNRLLDLNYDMPEYLTNQMTDEIKYSVNGSYILPNGIAVIVAIDLDKYLKGVLEFNYCEYFTPILEA